MNISKYIFLGAICLAAQGLQAYTTDGGYRNDGQSYISPSDGHYYDRSERNYVMEEHAQMQQALNRGDKSPSITTYGPDNNPQNAYKELSSYRGDNYAPQASQQNCPSGRCYQQYQNSNGNYQQQYQNQGNNQMRSDNNGRFNNNNMNVRSDNNGNFNSNRSDNDIAQNIRSEISNDNTLSHEAKMVQVAVNNGKVTLSGNVQNNGEKNKIDDLVHQTDGVSAVSNDITVTNK